MVRGENVGRVGRWNEERENYQRKEHSTGLWKFH